MPADATNSNHSCPRCNVSLADVQMGQDHLQQCPQCGAVFVDRKTFQKICTDQNTQTCALALKPPPPAPIAAAKPYLKCPQCRQLMNRYKFARGSAVVTSICRAHGIWLDRDAPRLIIEFIRGGGLERAREVENELGKMAKAAEELDRALAIGDSSHTPII